MSEALPASRFRVGITWLSATAAVLAPLVILATIWKLAVNVPFQDDWDTVDVVTKWHQGTLTFTDFWQQHSEHRILALRLLIWSLGILTGFNLVVEMLVGFGFAVLTLLVVRDLLTVSLKDHARALLPPMVAVSSVLLFSLTLQENWFWGTTSLQLLLLNLVSVTLIWALTRWPDRWNGLAIALCCAVVGMLAEASGFALWLTGAAAIWLAGKSDARRARRLALWTAAALLAIGAYVWGLHWQSGTVQAAALHPERFFLFAAACLGLPFAYGSPPAWSAAVGLSGCAALAAAVVYIYKVDRALVRSLHPIWLLALHGLLVSGMIGFGRSSLELKYAMASHYAFGPALFWIATIALAGVAARAFWTAASPLNLRIAEALVITAAALALGYGYFTANLQGYREAYARSRNLEMALASLYSQGITEDVSQLLYSPDDARLQQQIATLKKLKLGPFAARRQSENANLAERFKGRMLTGRGDGMLDGGDCYRIVGWAWDPAQPEVPIMVDVWYRGAKIGTASANWFRRDLRGAAIGNGQHAFVFYFPTMLQFGTGEAITVTYAGTSVSLTGSPRVITCE